MGRVFRWALRLFLVMAALSGLALVASYYLFSRSLPDYSATRAGAQVTGPVEIVRTNVNIPHIFADDPRDVFYGLGYAHAQDRLWQMILRRRQVQGRLAELLGRSYLQNDEIMRRLDLYGLARGALNAQSPAAQAALESYAAGVNAWLREINQDARGRGAPELFWFEPQIAPWSPADSLAILKHYAFELSDDMDREVLYARASLLLEPEQVRDLMPDDPGTGLATPQYAALFPQVTPSTAPRDYAARDLPLSSLKGRYFGGASNAFAASAERSALGGSILASDPHMALSAPSPWYLARLELPAGGVIGATTPGLPLILAGRNAQIGWGMTAAGADVQDIRIERLNPANPDEYQTADGHAPFRSRASLIGLDEGPAERITLRWSENGPVLPPFLYDIGTVTPPNAVATLSWPGLTEADGSFTAMFDLMQSQSIEDALSVTATHVSPVMNLVIADNKTVAMKMIGQLPKRNPRHQGEGRYPSEGWVETNQWDGFVPYAENPAFRDPEDGIVGNTNNKVVDRPFPDHVAFFWGDTQRVQRWERLMLNRPVHTRESFIEAQLDTVSSAARNLLALIGADLWFTGAAAPDGTPERQRQIALELMAAWSGEMSEHLPEPLIYKAWLRALQARLIRDELGELASAFTHVEPIFIERVFRDIDGAAGWCDVLQSAPVETCSDLSRMALDDAIVDLTERFGPNMESWRWGDAHVATHNHSVLGMTPFVNWVVNIHQSTSGDDDTLRRGSIAGTGDNPYRNIHAAGYRGVYDFGDLDSSVFVISTGQSGHPLSRHYDDLGVLWRRGEYVPMSLDPELARAGAVGITRLLPR